MFEKLRKCIVCKIEKPATVDFFHKDKNRPLGLMYRCKECEKKRKDKRIYHERRRYRRIQDRGVVFSNFLE